MEQQWCGKTQVSIHPRRFSTLTNILVTRLLRLDLLAGQLTLLKAQDSKCMNIRVAKKNVQSGHYCAKSSCIVLHSILFYSKNILKTLTKP